MSRSPSPSSESSDSPNTDRISIFVDVPPCPCPSSLMYTVKMVLRHHRMFGQGHLLHDITHDAVMITWQCRGCTKQFNQTCELARGGKRIRWGKYKFRQFTSRETNINVAKSGIFRAYDETSGIYKLRSNNCKPFAKAFFEKVEKKSRSDDFLCACNIQNHLATALELYKNDEDYCVTVHFRCTNCHRGNMMVTFFYCQAGKAFRKGRFIVRVNEERYLSINGPMSNVICIGKWRMVVHSTSTAAIQQFGQWIFIKLFICDDNKRRMA